MKIVRIIADSGGTKTDWICVDEKENETLLVTESYHPVHMDELFFNRQQTFWSQYDISSCTLQFYGSGCLHEAQQKKVRDVLLELGFSNVIVESDLFAAARAINYADCMVAICGTGSVLFRMKYDQLVEMRGGLGWETGDEGSGFYFGKLLLLTIQNSSQDVSEIIQAIEAYKSLDELYAMEGQPESKYVYAHLASVLQEYKSHPFVAAIHMANINLFLDQYAQGVKSIGFVGSYAYYHKYYFEAACKVREINTVGFIERPITILAKDLF